MLVAKLPLDLKAFVEEILAVRGVSSVVLTENDILNYEYDVIQNGLGATALDIFDQLGLESGDVNLALQINYVQSIYDLSGSYPSVLYGFSDKLTVGGAAVDEPGVLSLISLIFPFFFFGGFFRKTIS